MSMFILLFLLLRLSTLLALCRILCPVVSVACYCCGTAVILYPVVIVACYCCGTERLRHRQIRPWPRPQSPSILPTRGYAYIITTYYQYYSTTTLMMWLLCLCMTLHLWPVTYPSSPIITSQLHATLKPHMICRHGTW